MKTWLDKTRAHFAIKTKIKKSKEPTSTFYVKHDGGMRPINLKDLYYNSSCFVVAGGPSLANMDISALNQPGILTLGLNNSPKSFRPDIWVSVDEPARFLESVWRDPKIMKFCGTGKAEKRIWDHDKWEYSSTVVQDCPNVIHISRNNHFQASKFLTEKTINWGNHRKYGGGRSCFVATFKIMYILGIRRVYLLGVDFRMTEKYTYNFEEQRAKGAVKNNQTSYLRMLSYFTQLAPFLKKAGYQIWNCTPESDLSIFPYLDINEAVKRELKDIPDPETEKTYGMYVPKR